MNNTKKFSATFASIKKTYTLTNVNKNEFTDFISRNAYSSTDNKIFKKNVIMMNVSTEKKFSISPSKITQNKNKNKFIYIFKFINSAIISIFEKILQNEIKINFENILNMYSQLSKLFFQKCKRIKIFFQNVDIMHVDSIEIVDVNIKNYYFTFIFKMSIRMNVKKKIHRSIEYES